jgi:hypothetical protein
MAAHRSSVRISVGLATALGLLVFFPPRAFAAETARSIGSLTPDQRNHLPDNTQVTLPRRGTVTLGTLRAEHRARLDRFSRAGMWGKRVAERMALSKPKALSSASATAIHGSSTLPPGAIQNSSVVAQGGANTKSVTNANAAGQPPQKQGGGVSLSKAGAGGGSRVAAPPPSDLNGPAKHTNIFQWTLIARPSHNGPLPLDYVAFCNAVTASACIYVPPNTTFTTYTPNPNGYNRFLIDVDPLITDPGVCFSFGGVLDGQQQCEFTYFWVQQISFKPGLTPAIVAYCPESGGDYNPKPQLGWILAFANMDAAPNGATTWTGSTPQTCVLQAWISQ